MGLRYRKTIKAGPLRVTASKSGISTSIGGKGARITKTANGKTRTTLSIPGTGLSYVSETGGKKARGKAKKNQYSPEYLAAVELAQEQHSQDETEAHIAADKRKEEKRLEREKKKKMRMPQKPPKSVKAVHTSGIALIVIGACLLVIPPVGAIVLALGIYMTVKAPKIYAESVEKYEAAMAEREMLIAESVGVENGSSNEIE
jgi:hypothetical protein